MSYDLRVKENTLHISEELIEKYTAESMQVTVEMINKGKELLHADLYVACTGLLKKGGSETPEKPVGNFTQYIIKIIFIILGRLRSCLFKTKKVDLLCYSRYKTLLY